MKREKAIRPFWSMLSEIGVRPAICGSDTRQVCMLLQGLVLILRAALEAVHRVNPRSVLNPFDLPRYLDLFHLQAPKLSA